MKQYKLTWRPRPDKPENTTYYIMEECARDTEDLMKAWGYETRIEEVERPLGGYDD